jgi:hypothetical protein
MSTCAVCGSYFRISRYHTDTLNCEDCSGHKYIDDPEIELEIQQILHPSGKTASIRYDEDSQD